MKKYLLEIIVFVSGFGIMVFELIGSRILAPYVGTTIIVWSALIGVILAFLSAGYWWGGKIADKKANYKYFSKIIFSAGALVALTAFVKIPVISFLDQYISSLQLEATIISMVLFGPASFFMAAVAPYAVRLRLHSVEESGETVGRLSAIASIGSIVGAFITGMFLVTVIGSTAILFILAFILILASILAYRGSGLKVKGVTLAIALLLPFFSVQIDRFFLPLDFIHSAYMDIALQDGKYTYTDLNTGESVTRPILQMYTSPTALQSVMFTDADDDLVLPYSKFFRIVPEILKPDLKDALVIGGAGYSIPKDFLRRNPNGNIDVVEIDPKMTEVAKEHFNLKDDPRLTIYHEDGRTYLNRNQKKYDVVMIDSFRAFTVPFQLTTLESMKRVYDSLNDDGIMVVNLYQSIEGDGGKFFRAEYKTVKELFPQVYVFRVNSPNPEDVQNLIMVATKSSERVVFESEDKEVGAYLAQIWDEPIKDDVEILTDDFAPVAHYMRVASKHTK